MLFSLLFIVLSFVGAVLAVGLAVVAGRRPPAPGRGPFVVQMIGAGVWVLLSAVQMLIEIETVKIFVINLQYVGIFMTVAGWFAFAVEYTRRQWFPGWGVGLLLIEPILISIAMWTNPLHELFRSDVVMQRVGVLTTIGVSFRPLFWVHTVYSYGLMVAGFVVLTRAFVRSPELYRGQILWLVLAGLTPMVPNVITITGGNPIPVDITSLFFVLSGFFVGYSLFRFRLLDVVPIARDMVVEGLDDMMIVLDAQDRVVDLNPAARQVLGQTGVIGQPVETLLSEEQKAQFAGYRQVQEAQAEVRFDDRIYDVRISPLYQSRGQLVGRLVVLHDITERVNLIAELDAYARTVAHDLKAPVNVVRGYAELIEEDGEAVLSERARGYLQTITDTSRKMEGIIDSLLVLARVRSQEGVNVKPLETREIVLEVLANMNREIDDAQAQVMVADGAWPVVLGYAPWVEAVWVNYISNAIKYGGEPPVIELGADVWDGMARFWVQDNGRGIGADQQESLFVEFARLDEHVQQAGHGLGLSIVRRIVERLGGEVGVESKPGQGSRFYFTLPVAG